MNTLLTIHCEKSEIIFGIMEGLVIVEDNHYAIFSKIIAPIKKEGIEPSFLFFASANYL